MWRSAAERWSACQRFTAPPSSAVATSTTARSRAARARTRERRGSSPGGRWVGVARSAANASAASGRHWATSRESRASVAVIRAARRSRSASGSEPTAASTASDQSGTLVTRQSTRYPVSAALPNAATRGTAAKEPSGVDTRTHSPASIASPLTGAGTPPTSPGTGRTAATATTSRAQVLRSSARLVWVPGTSSSAVTVCGSSSPWMTARARSAALGERSACGSHRARWADRGRSRTAGSTWPNLVGQPKTWPGGSRSAGACCGGLGSAHGAGSAGRDHPARRYDHPRLGVVDRGRRAAVGGPRPQRRRQDDAAPDRFGADAPDLGHRDRAGVSAGRRRRLRPASTGGWCVGRRRRRGPPTQHPPVDAGRRRRRRPADTPARSRCPRSGASAPKRSGAASSCLRRWGRGPPTAARRPRSTTPSRGWSYRRAGWSRPADPAPCADPNPPQHAPAERLPPGHVFGCPTKLGQVDPAVLDLPRSAHLALWLPHADRSPSAAERALAVIQGEDEPHTVTADDDVPGTHTSLAELLNTWAREVVAVAAVLPVPGDVGGVPAPVSGDAIDAGECVLVSTPEGSFAAVPQVAAFGSVADTGYLVDWRVTRVPDWSLAVLAAVGSLPDAERDLRAALTTATDSLDSLEVAHWRPDAAEALAALRATPTHLPPGLA